MGANKADRAGVFSLRQAPPPPRPPPQIDFGGWIAKTGQEGGPLPPLRCFAAVGDSLVFRGRGGRKARGSRDRRSLQACCAECPLLEESRVWQEGRLAQQVKEEVVKWIQVNQRFRKGTRRKRQRPEKITFQKLSPDQLVLLLESLLQKRTFCSKTLEYLQNTYHLREQDAEVRHRWCELIIKHKHVAGYADVEKFLKEDQAMGVYLYGELMLNEDAKQQEIAYKTFATIRDQMDASTTKVVAEMLSDKERQRL